MSERFRFITELIAIIFVLIVVGCVELDQADVSQIQSDCVPRQYEEYCAQNPQVMKTQFCKEVIALWMFKIKDGSSYCDASIKR